MLAYARRCYSLDMLAYRSAFLLGIWAQEYLGMTRVSANEIGMFCFSEKRCLAQRIHLARGGLEAIASFIHIALI